MFVETTGRTHITRHVRNYENLPFWSPVIESVSSVAQPPPSPHIDANTPVATIHLLQPVPSLRTKTNLHAVHLPVRKSAKGLIPKKQFPMDMDCATVDTHPRDASMYCFISLALKSSSLYYEPKTFREAVDGPEGIL